MRGLIALGILRRNKIKRQDPADNIQTSGSGRFTADADAPDNVSRNFELIAVITAAVQAFMGRNKQNKLIVKSFRRISSDNSVWNITARNEQLNGKL